MAVLGGVGHVWGAFLGAAVVKLTEDQLQVLLPKLIGTSGNFEIIVFGLVMIVVLKYAPDGLWTFIARWLPAPKRVRDWADAKPLPARDKPRKGEPLLQVDAVRKEFGGLVAVNDISFNVNAGDIVGLIGPNGAGKSTTFNLITGVLSLTRGGVRFRGQPVGGLSSRQIAERGMSRTFQHVKMIPEMTVLENVALGGYLRSRSGTLRAMLRLDRAEERGLSPRPSGNSSASAMDGMGNELAGNLALGPQRLMEIARALCTDPALLLLTSRRGSAPQGEAGPGRRAAAIEGRGPEHPAGRARHGLRDGPDRPHRGDGVRHPPDRRHTGRGAGQPGGARRLPRHGALTMATTATTSANNLLQVTGLHAGYGRAEVLTGLDFHLAAARWSPSSAPMVPARAPR